ncbi:terpenoid synthase [Rhodocollybia butyracea]|uniref:Terpenoid synthase n=1 Tax=Rhodocollybia butyracea TaxID=206335 RepID=A0A9P5U0D0_9AGAR|nr:terpenoid synthase [Rhodocollybia butyracea]
MPGENHPLSALEKGNPKGYISRLQFLLHEVEYRHIPSSPPIELLRSHNSWTHDTLGPMTPWTKCHLDAVAKMSLDLPYKAYPYADTEVIAVIGKLTALVLYIDDSLETADGIVYDEIGSFAYHVFMGKPQPFGILNLYHVCIKELLHLFEGDTALRGLAVWGWINYIDGCLLEKRLLTTDTDNLSKRRCNGISNAAQETSPKAGINFPLWMRNKTAIGESFIAPIFHSTEEQGLPLSRYLRALPDISYFIGVMNDILSFHKEELAGESVNMIHLQTHSFKESRGSGPSGEWTALDTFNHLCNEVRDAIYRINEILRVQDCEKIVRDGSNGKSMGLSEVDVAIALRWRKFKDGYISWHLETPRYKLDFIRPEQFQTD